MSKNLLCPLREKNSERILKANYVESKILNEVYKLEYEKHQKQNREIDGETLKRIKQLNEIQNRIDSLDISTNYDEFKKLPSDIRELAIENI